MRGNEQEYAAWLKTRPECVQQLAAEFPAGSIVRTPKGDLYVLGWNEDDMLIISKADPSRDYDRAVATKEYLCAKHLRANIEAVLDRP